MIAIIVCIAAGLLLVAAINMGLGCGAVVALRYMLCAVFSLLVALRVAFPAARAASQFESAPAPVLACVVLWAVFLLLWLATARMCDSYFENFEAMNNSLIDRALGGLFGLVSGGALVAMLLLCLGLVSPLFWPEYDRKALPFPADTAAVDFFRTVESRAAFVPADDPAHTRLPDITTATSTDPAKLWQ